MKKIKKIVVFAVATVMTLSLAGCNMIQKTPEAMAKTVVAKVGDEKITLGDIDKELEPFFEQVKAQYGDDYKSNEEATAAITKQRVNVTNAIVENKVLLKKAEELNLVPAEEDLNKEIDEQYKKLQDMYGGAEQLNTQLEQNGFTEESFKERIKERVIVNKVIEDMVKDVAATDEDLKKYYDENKDSQFTKKAGADMKHILFETEEEAKKAKAEIDAGTSFEDEFKKYEENKKENKKPVSEDLNFVEYDKQGFDEDFLKGVKDLKEGEVSNPIKSAYGYHIVKATNLKTEPTVMPFEDVKDDIKNAVEGKMKQDKLTQTLEEWKKELKAEVYEDKLTLKTEGAKKDTKSESEDK